MHLFLSAPKRILHPRFKTWDEDELFSFGGRMAEVTTNAGVVTRCLIDSQHTILLHLRWLPWSLRGNMPLPEILAFI